MPYAELTLSDVVALQPYDISLQLVVPANEANIALGNFMATLTLSTFSNRTIAISRKPVRLCLYESTMYGILSTCAGNRGPTLCRSLVVPLQQAWNGGHQHPHVQ